MKNDADEFDDTNQQLFPIENVDQLKIDGEQTED